MESQARGPARRIVGFHRDPEGWWVAELACGHTQHVRHDPPWQVRPWTRTEAGRAGMLGAPLRCPACASFAEEVSRRRGGGLAQGPSRTEGGGSRPDPDIVPPPHAGGPRPMADVHTLADMVAYQPGSVVSRKVLGGRRGNVTLFAFDEGEGLTEHTSPYDAMVVVLDGRAEIRVGEVTREVGEGETITLPADVPHALHARGARFKMMLIMIRDE